VSSDLDKYRGLGPKVRMRTLLVMGVLALWVAWRANEAPEGGSAISCCGFSFLIVLYLGSMVDWVVAHMKADKEQKQN
jgi:hypothetical protein